MLANSAMKAVIWQGGPLHSPPGAASLRLGVCAWLRAGRTHNLPASTRSRAGAYPFSPINWPRSARSRQTRADYSQAALLTRGEVISMDSSSGDTHRPMTYGLESDSRKNITAESPTNENVKACTGSGSAVSSAARQESYPAGSRPPLGADRRAVVLTPDGAEVLAWVPRLSLSLLSPILRSNGLIVSGGDK